jgi:hypothetical protein
MTTRRAFSFGFAASLSLPGPLLAQAHATPAANVCRRDNLPPDPLAFETADQALQRGSGKAWRKPELKAAVTAELWKSVKPAPLSALWPEGGDATPDQTLTVSHAKLSALLADQKTEPGVVVVAVRGARATSANTLWQSSIALTARAPDHHNFCCTIVLWDRSAQRVAGFIGSTVPNRTALVAAGLGVKSANMLKPGLFRYSVGGHSYYGAFGCAYGIPDALRQNARGAAAVKLPAWRPTRTDGLASARTGSTQDDNLHCAETPLLEPWDRFSSEGCMVVAGSYSPATGSTGAWAQFQGLLAGDPRSARSLWLLHAGQLV